MADPFTIIGTTSAVITFAQFAGNIISTAYSLYESTTDGTAENERLEDVTSKMNQLLDNLSAEKAAKPLSSQDKSIAELAASCHDLGEKILTLLKKTKVQKAHSLRASVRAAMATVWTKSVVNELRKELEFCTAQLSLHLQTIVSSETGQKLQMLMDANTLNARELSSVKALLDSVKKGQGLETESLTQLRDILSRSKSNLESMNRERILKGLEFQDMETRFVEVSGAAKETFEWCVQDSEVPKSCPGLKISLREWLRKGNGVFHITGKPGAGKSTLMKFLADHKETTTQLKEWAGTRTLVVARFFFWKPGRPLQKSLKGLIRCLVHSILASLPDLISGTFPQFWNPGKILPWQPQTELKIPYDMVLSAFNHLVKSSGGMKDHCFCFFIDGLDEFDDPDEHHAMLAERLQTWTDINPDGLKICVSSREENAFLNQFSTQQRLKLHLLTEGDIRRMTTNSLQKHPRFRRSTMEDREELIDTIVSQAQGVFLWVKLVLNEICDGLDELLPEQSLQSLHGLLKTIPEDLEKFFSYILGSISKSKRIEAWTVLALAMATKKFPVVAPLSLVHYSFVGEFSKSKCFGTRQPIRNANVQEIKDRVDSFRKRLKGLCRGLVEPIDLRKTWWKEWKDDDLGNQAFKDSIAFTHRSVYEFLQQGPPKDVKEFFDTLDVSSVLLQCLIAQTKLLPFSRGVRFYTNNLVPELFQNISGFNFKDEHVEQLGFLDDALLYRQCGATVKEFNWSLFTDFETPGFKSRDDNLISILAYSCFYGFQSYVAWSFDNRPNFILDNRTCAKLLIIYVRGLTSFRPHGNVNVLRYLLQQGFSPNPEDGASGIGDSEDGGWEDSDSSGALVESDSVWTGWERYVRYLIERREISTLPPVWWEAMHVFLQYGVDPHFSFLKKQIKREDRCTIFATNGLPPNSKNYSWKVSSPRSSDLTIDKIHAKGGEVSLRDVVGFYRPNDMELLSLIDRNLALYKERARLAMLPKPAELMEPAETDHAAVDTEKTEAEKLEAEKNEEDESVASEKDSRFRRLWPGLGMIPKTLTISLLSSIVALFAVLILMSRLAS